MCDLYNGGCPRVLYDHWSPAVRREVILRGRCAGLRPSRKVKYRPRNRTTGPFVSPDGRNTMNTEALYLLDQLEAADMLEIDALHAWHFELDEALLDEADAASEAGLPYASEQTVVTIEGVDGRERRVWRFSYNQVMEAEYLIEEDTWLLENGKHRLRCLGAISVDDEA